MAASYGIKHSSVTCHGLSATARQRERVPTEAMRRRCARPRKSCAVEGFAPAPRRGALPNGGARMNAPTPVRAARRIRDAGLPPLPDAASLALAAFVLVGLVLASRGAYVALLVPVVLLAGYALVRYPDAATSLFAIVLYTNAPVIAVQIHHVPFAFAAAFPLLLCVPIGRDLLRGKAPVIAPAMPFVLAYFTVQLAGALFAVRPEESMDGLLTFVL